VAPSSAIQPNGSSDDPSISADGTAIAFTSAASNLVTTDTNNVQDVFVWTKGATSSTVQLVSANAAGAAGTVPGTVGIGGTASTNASNNPVISADGTVTRTAVACTVDNTNDLVYYTETWTGANKYAENDPIKAIFRVTMSDGQIPAFEDDFILLPASDV
jgi:hypothetical protein